MEYFPIFLDLKNRPALVVGGGELALRKLRLLQKAGAQVTVVAPRDRGGDRGLRRRPEAPRLRRRRCRWPGHRLRGHGSGGGGRPGGHGGAPGGPAGQCRRPAPGIELHHAGDRRTRSDRRRHLQRRGRTGSGAAAARGDRAAAALAPRPARLFRRELPQRRSRTAARWHGAPALLGRFLRRPRRRIGAGGGGGAGARGDALARQRPESECPWRRAPDAGHRPARRHRPRQSRSPDPARPPGHAARRCRRP